jgi:hypothetical protein
MNNIGKRLTRKARSLIRYPNQILFGQKPAAKSESKIAGFEYIDSYGNTSMFALDVVRKKGDVSRMRLLSLGCRMNHLADYAQIFQSVHHNTMLDTHIPIVAENGNEKLVTLRKDFFTLSPLDVDCVISQATLQCYNWTAYGNQDFGSDVRKSYRVPQKLRSIIGEKSIPIIISVPVGHEEHLFDNNAHLSAETFVNSFTDAGFNLQLHFFDYVSGSLPLLPEYLKPEYRRASSLPGRDILDNEWKYVIGNYYFLS